MSHSPTYAIEYTDPRGKKEILEHERFRYHSRELAEMAVFSLTATNNPAWQGTFAVVEILDGRP